MRTFLVAIGGVFLGLGLLVWLRSQITYRVGRESLRVMLFNFTLRRVPLQNIKRVSKRVHGAAERWANTFWPSHRQLVIHHTGSTRPLVITPANRYVVKAELLRIIGQVEEENEPTLAGQDGAGAAAEKA